MSIDSTLTFKHVAFKPSRRWKTPTSDLRAYLKTSGKNPPSSAQAFEFVRGSFVVLMVRHEGTLYGYALIDGRFAHHATWPESSDRASVTADLDSWVRTSARRFKLGHDLICSKIDVALANPYELDEAVEALPDGDAAKREAMSVDHPIGKFKHDVGAAVHFVFNQELGSSYGVFESFRERYGKDVVFRASKDGFLQFLYVPGRRKDRALLVAHSDTVWQHGSNVSKPKQPKQPKLNVDQEKVVRSTQLRVGIGADDRAGVGMVWQLADLGHSILIVDTEEIGMLSSKFLRSNEDVFDEIQKTHSFIVQFDRKGSRDFKCYDVGTDKFRSYLSESLQGFDEPDRTSFTDICVLCRDICGVNLSVGYENEHTDREMLDLKTWSDNIDIYRQWLSKPLPRFEL